MDWPPEAPGDQAGGADRPTDRGWGLTSWYTNLLNAAWRPLALDELASYSKRHKIRQCGLLLASVAMLAVWIIAHQRIAPDIAHRSVLFLGVGVIPHTLLVFLVAIRLKPSWREYAVMYAMVVAYGTIQYLFSLSRSEPAPFLLVGTCVLFLIISNLMMRLRVGNASVMTLFTMITGVWMFARQGSGGSMLLVCTICAVAVGGSTLYLNYFIGEHEMYYLRQEQHFGLVLSGGKRDLWEFDPERKILRYRPWNQVSSEASVSYSWQQYLALVHPDYRLTLVRAMEDCRTGRATQVNLEYLVQAPGRADWRWLHLVGHAEKRNMDAGAGRLIGTACDITDRKALHAQVEETARDLKKAARQKAQFLATMSHSIRTPLNAVIGAASMLAVEELDGEAREMVQTIQRSGQVLLTVLNDVLDVESFYGDAPRIELVAFNPAAVIKHCVELVYPLAQRKNLDLLCSPAPALSDRLSGDPVRLEQVLINLLSNAIKFTDRGSVSLTASLEPSGPGSQVITFAVTDTGVGIDEIAQRSLFERFEQVHPQRPSEQAGTGLGLAISKRLVEAMGGIIVCKSKPGQGSRFAFTLRFPIVPAEGSDSPDRAIAEESMIPPGGGESVKERVLVAEDNPVNRRVMAAMLKRLNCDVQLAANGAEAVEACTKSLFDVVFMDCDMPVLNGLEATRRIRLLANFEAVPIIAATAHALPENLEACLTAGMSDVLTKPITLAQLTDKLRHWAHKPDIVLSKA